MATLHNLFEQAREEAGGAAEAELQNRYPDRRLWNAYNQRWKRELRKRLRLCDSSLLGSVSLAAGAYQTTLGAGDIRLSLVVVQPTDPNDTGQGLIQTTRESLLRDGYDLTAQGDPTHCYMDIQGTTGLSILSLWPVPEAAVTLSIFGDGTPAEELQDSDFDADAPDGMLKNLTPPSPLPPGWYNPYEVQARMPDMLFLSCVYYLAWFMLHTDERARGTPIENNQYALFQTQFHDDLAEYNLTLPLVAP
jgi:hypothetical protein